MTGYPLKRYPVFIIRFRHKESGIIEKNKKISTQMLIMEVDFCPVLCIPEVPVLQAFQGIGHFVWYCKAVSDLS